MSDSKQTNSKGGSNATPTRPQQLRLRINQLRQSRQRSIFGTPEIIGLCAATLMLLAVIFSYLYFLSPAETRLAARQRDLSVLQDQLIKAKQGVTQGKDTQATIADITHSLQTFESTRLTRRNEGRVTLFEVLNQLIRRNNLRNTAGPAYAALDALNPNAPQGTAARSGNAKWQSLYPGISVGVTVEGQYQNLRRFLRDIEASNQFIIINAVELEGVTDTNAPPSASLEPTTSTGLPATPAARPTLVSLRLNLVAYYQREGGNASAQQMNQAR
jgi:Tfp pilus assembly protein PilO